MCLVVLSVSCVLTWLCLGLDVGCASLGLAFDCSFRPLSWNLLTGSPLSLYSTLPVVGNCFTTFTAASQVEGVLLVVVITNFVEACPSHVTLSILGKRDLEDLNRFVGGVGSKYYLFHFLWYAHRLILSTAIGIACMLDFLDLGTCGKRNTNVFILGSGCFFTPAYPQVTYEWENVSNTSLSDA